MFGRCGEAMKNWIFAAGLAAVAVGGWWWQTASDGATSTTPAPAGTAPVAVSALGRLEPASRLLEIAAPNTAEAAVIDELLVIEGQQVLAGDLLATLDNFERRQAALEQAKASLQASEAKLQQVLAGAKLGEIEAAEAAVAMAKAELGTRQRELQRSESLGERRAISESEVDSQRLAVQLSEARVMQAEGELAAIREVRPTDLAVAEAEVANAKAAVSLASADLANASIVAPLDGRILRIHARQGEKIGSRGLLEMGDVQHMQAVAEVFEGDLPLVAIGQRAAVRLDTRDMELTGTVTEIGNVVARKDVLTNDPVSDTDARVVEVRIDLDKSSDHVIERLSNARVDVLIHLKTVAAPSRLAATQEVTP